MGRKRTILLANLVQVVGAVLQASAFSMAHFIVARCILGIGTGGIVATVSVWQSELVKAESRGQHVSAFGIFAGLGTSCALWIAFGMSYTQPSSASWRFTLGFPIFLSILACALMVPLPESPRWLCKVRRPEEARETLALLYDGAPDSVEVSRIMDDIQLSLELSGHANVQSLFSMGRQRTLNRLLLAGTVQILLQLTGVNSVTYYAPTIYVLQLKFTPETAFILAAASQAVFVFGSYLCAYTVDHVGRRKLLLFSSASISVCMGCLTGVVSNPTDEAALKAGVFFLYLFYFLCSLGYVGLPFLYASEVAPAHLRAAVCGISTAVSWIFNFLVAEVTPVATTSIGYKYFLVWVATNAAAVPIVYLFFPETAGRTLEEIDEIFAASQNAFDPVRVARKLPRLHLAEHVRAENQEKDTVGDTPVQVEQVKEAQNGEQQA